MQPGVLFAIAVAVTGAVAQLVTKRDQSTNAAIQRIGNIMSLDGQLLKDHQTLADGPPADAVIAFFAEPLCQGVPQYLRAQNVTCYGPISSQATFTLLAADRDCQVLIRRHPCGVDNDATIMATDGSCYAGNSLASGLDVWVQCGVAPVTQAEPSQTISAT